ncbi:hypothetical protein EW145_g906 [Phellinidium pouzarii]|uniref:Uncharacterized protein n=1 Tax=Phellinidium pouzarii TaxID=167371 RepID=A0A4S4LH70_9AGAM|nr:hypothetical protein EW145_g906 [Phellinidium pouzarii]
MSETIITVTIRRRRASIVVNSIVMRLQKRPSHSIQYALSIHDVSAAIHVQGGVARCQIFPRKSGIRSINPQGWQSTHEVCPRSGDPSHLRKTSYALKSIPSSVQLCFIICVLQTRKTNHRHADV